MLKLWDWIKRLFHRENSTELPEATLDNEKRQNEWSAHMREHVDLPQRPKAIHQEVSRFMKHGHQAPWYRKSVKVKVQPDEEED